MKKSHDFNFGKTFGASDVAASGTAANPFDEGTYSPGPDKVPSRQRPPKYSKTLTGDDKDKAYALESENFDLKQKENFLEEKIVLMRTKLRRIEELLTKRELRKQGLPCERSGGYLESDVGDTFAAEIRQMGSENDHLREQNKKLRVIERDFAAKNVVQKKPENKYGHVKGKLPNHKMKQSE